MKIHTINPLILGLVLCCLIACNNSNNTPQTAPAMPVGEQTDSMPVAPMSVEYFFDATTQALLEQYFGDSLTLKLSNNLQALHKAASDMQFEKAFLEAQILQEQLEEASYSIQNSTKITKALEPVKTALMPYFATYSEEGMEFKLLFDNNTLLQLAKKTKGKSDDTFCQLMKLAEGKQGGRPMATYKFFEMQYEYVGGSVLGDSSCFNFMNQSWAHLQTTPLFREHVLLLREACIKDMNRSIHMLSETAVKREISRIVDAGILTTDESLMVLDIQENLAMKPELYQFDCRTKECDFGE